MKILIFRTAAPEIMGKLFAEVLMQEVYCYVQKDCCEFYKKQYPNIRFLEITDEYFQYKNFHRYSKLPDGIIDTVYVPSSSPYFYNFEDVFFIIDELEYKNMILYDCNGNKRVFRKKNAYVQYIMSSVWSAIFGFIYKLKCKWS